MKEVTEIVSEDITSELGMVKYTGDRTLPTRDEVAQLAFRFYELRGRQDGHDTEDWLRAEQELARHYA